MTREPMRIPTPTESLLSSSPTPSSHSELDYVQVSSFQPSSFNDDLNVQNQISSGIQTIIQDLASLRKEMNRNQVDNKNQMIDLSVQLREIQTEVLAWNENSLDPSEMDEDVAASHGFGTEVSNTKFIGRSFHVNCCPEVSDNTIEEHRKQALESNRNTFREERNCIKYISSDPNSPLYEPERVIISRSPSPSLADIEFEGMPPLISLEEANELDVLRANGLDTSEKMVQMLVSLSNGIQRQQRKAETKEDHIFDASKVITNLIAAINYNSHFIDGGKVEWRDQVEKATSELDGKRRVEDQKLDSSAHTIELHNKVDVDSNSQQSPRRDIQLAIDDLHKLVNSKYRTDSSDYLLEETYVVAEIRRTIDTLQEKENFERMEVAQKLKAMENKDIITVHSYDPVQLIDSSDYSLWKKKDEGAVASKTKKIRKSKLSATPQIDELLNDMRFSLDPQVQTSSRQSSNSLPHPSPPSLTLDVPIVNQTSKQEKFFRQSKPTIIVDLQAEASGKRQQENAAALRLCYEYLDADLTEEEKRLAEKERLEEKEGRAARRLQLIAEAGINRARMNEERERVPAKIPRAKIPRTQKKSDSDNWRSSEAS